MGDLRRRNPINDCPLTAALAALGGRWKLIIVYWLADEPRHFSALRRLMPSISQKVLTEQLRELAADGVVARAETGAAPAPVVYSLTDYGRRAVTVAESMRAWGRTHIGRFREAEGRRRGASSDHPPERDPAGVNDPAGSRLKWLVPKSPQ